MESGDVKEPVVAAAGPANSAAELASPRSKKKRSGPRRTSFERRISARVVYLLAFSIFVATIAVMRSGAVGASWLRTLVWAACLSYLPSYFDGSEFTVEGRHWPWFATLGVFRHFHNYFSFRLEYTTPIDETKRYIICSHPHGVLSAHHPMYLTHKSFLSVFSGEKKRHVGATIVFKIPVFRDMMLWLGIVDADRELVEEILRRDYTLVTLQGGISEQVRTVYGEPRVYVKARRGVCELSIISGRPIIPAYAFGETELVSTPTFARSLSIWIAEKFRVAVQPFFGRFGLPLFPYRVPILAVMGAPIPVSQKDNPTEEEISAVQQQYIAQLVAIFEKNKHRVPGYENKTLIVE